MHTQVPAAGGDVDSGQTSDIEQGGIGFSPVPDAIEEQLHGMGHQDEDFHASSGRVGRR